MPLKGKKYSESLVHHQLIPKSCRIFQLKYLENEEQIDEA